MLTFQILTKKSSVEGFSRTIYWKNNSRRKYNKEKYVNVIYEETLTSIRQNIQDGPIWVSIDESTYVDGRYVGNVIVGKLSSEPCNSFLLNCEKLDKCNHKTIAKLFNDSMNLLWPEGVKYENVFLFLSDAAPYMCKAGNVLNEFFPKLIHVTCLAHGFHRVVETIRSRYSDIDQLIATVKKIFHKAPSRVLKFKELNLISIYLQSLF